MNPEYFYLTVLSLYFLEHLILTAGLYKNLKRSKTKSLQEELPIVTIIVGAKNEEKNIGTCVDSILKLDYPAEKLQIIIIDNHSSDSTREILEDYQEAGKVIFLETEPTQSKLAGKTLALSQAISKSSGKLIFTTDADCIVKPSWVKEIVKYYDDKTAGVCSYTLIEPNNMFSGMQAFDWLYLLTLCAGSDGINNQLSCVGNNMSYTLNSYNNVGGYENIEFSVTEDFKLLQTIKEKLNDVTLKFPVDEKIVNITLPCADFKELYRQKQRWGKGGLESKLLGYIVGFLGWSTGGLILFGWIYGIELYLLFLCGKFIIDLLFTMPVIIRFKYYRALKYFLVFEIYFAIYSFFLPFILLFDREVVWKGVKYR